MFAGKTTELIRRLENACAVGVRGVAVKPAADVRSGAGRMVAHTGQRFDAVDVTDAASVVTAAADADVLGLDELHFFDTDIADACRQLADRGTRVIAAGVDYDERGELFAATARLLDIADDVTRLTARCTVCGGVARYTQRMVADDARIVVGGAEAYEPRCAKCFLPKA